MRYSLFYIIIGTLMLAPRTMLAKLQVDAPDGQNLGDRLGLPQGKLDDTVINAVQWVLGFLGLAAVMMIIIGGYRYLTAGGDEDKVTTAKLFIKNAVIGLVITLLAWSIAYFVFSIAKKEFAPETP